MDTVEIGEQLQEMVDATQGTSDELLGIIGEFGGALLNLPEEDPLYERKIDALYATFAVSMTAWGKARGVWPVLPKSN